MKKSTRLILGLVLVAAIFSCKKNDDATIIVPEVIDKPDPKPDPVNQAPNSFLLLTPETDSTIVNRTPTFSWEQATDPDGDMVTYDLYLDTEENPTALIAENLTTTSFELTENLDFETQYYWKVIAKDGKGATTERSQSLQIDIPNQLLTSYDTNRESGSIEFEYAGGYLKSMDNYLVDLEGNRPILKQLTNTNNNVKHSYQFTAFEKQDEVFVQYGEDSHHWIFEYDSSDRIKSVKREYQFNDKGGSNANLNEAEFKYDNATSVHPSQIEISFEVSVYMISLKWQNQNIIEMLWEFDYGKGDGFEFEGLVKIAYDDNINPYNPILSEQFGFDSFYVLRNSPSGLQSIEFGLFQWQSFNNITAYELFDTPEGDGDADEDNSYTKIYEYNEFYYPITATVGSRESYQETWIYKEQ